MFTRNRIALAAVGGLILSLVASNAALAGQQKPRKPTPAPAAVTEYECVKCKMRYPAAVAKKDKFIDPMDGGKLVAVKPTPKKAPTPKPKAPKPSTTKKP